MVFICTCCTSSFLLIEGNAVAADDGEEIRSFHCSTTDENDDCSFHCSATDENDDCI